MVCVEKTGTDNLYAMVRYCHCRTGCRRRAFASHFGEEYSPEWCNAMCDVCSNGTSSDATAGRSNGAVSNGPSNDCKVPEISSKHREESLGHLSDLLPYVNDLENRITPLKLLELWLKNAGKGRSREMGERVILDLIVMGYLREDYHFTPYSIVVYVVPTSKCFEDVVVVE